jgi:hypothetical protein
MSRTLVTEIKQCVSREKNKSWPLIMAKESDQNINSESVG